MQINFKNINEKSNDIGVFAEINKEAFPINERLEMEEMLKFAKATNTDVLGIYDGENPIGFSLITKNDRCGYIYYYAIDKGLRSKGYGSAALRELVRKYEDLQIVLDFEATDENAENNEQRIRRRKFYLGNGFYETGRYTLLSGERFEVVCSCRELDADGFMDLLKIIHQHREEFPDILI